jgi:hypothetical protein
VRIIIHHSQIENDLPPTPSYILIYHNSEITISPTFHKFAKSSFKKFFWKTLAYTLGFPISFSYIISLKIKCMRELYWKFCNWIGYIIVFRDWYDPQTFTLKRKNSHLSLLKYTSKVDENGWRRVKEIWQIQIKKI